MALPIGALMNAVPELAALQGRHDAAARTMMGSPAAVIPAAPAFLPKGHPRQMDAHLYFLVGMTALAIPADWRPMVLATLYHAALERLSPDRVFTGSAIPAASAFPCWR